MTAVEPEPDCPWCGSRDMDRLAEFGCNLLVRPYRCRSCGSPCEVIRKRGRPGAPVPDAPDIAGSLHA